MQRREFLLATAGLYLAGQSAAMAGASGVPTVAGPIVPTRYGRLQGRTHGSVHLWKGIAYGADTGGSNRFLPPQRPKAFRVDHPVLWQPVGIACARYSIHLRQPRHR